METKPDLQVQVSNTETMENSAVIKNVYGFSVDPRFTDLVPIGQGGNGMVFSAVDSDCEKNVAIKKISFCDQPSCRYALRELRVVRQLQHENVVAVYEILGPNGYSLDGKHTVTTESSSFNSIYIVQEHMDVSLSQLIQSCQLSREHVKFFLYQLLRGLKYIHSANLIHRDIKPPNILLSLDDLMLKIGDFGLARVVDPAYSHRGYLTDRVGTCWYRAPELILTPRDYSQAIDMWGVGCILAEMLTGQPLFPGAQEMEQMGHILDTVPLTDNEWNRVTQILPSSIMKKYTRFPKRTLRTQFPGLETQATEMLESMLKFSPCSRTSAEMALGHPYLEQYACLEDEPVVCRPFRIEHEVDDLSVETLRHLILSEGKMPALGCGSQNPPMAASLKHPDHEPITVPGNTSETFPRASSSPPGSAASRATETGAIINPVDGVSDRLMPPASFNNDVVKAKNSQPESKVSKESLFIDVSDFENAKEFCQPSPKERADRINCQHKIDQQLPDKNSLAMSVKLKDRVNAQRRGKPHFTDLSDYEIPPPNTRLADPALDPSNFINDRNTFRGLEGAKFDECQKGGDRNILKSPDDFCVGYKEKSHSKESLFKKQMARQKKGKQKSVTNRDFDSLYRLPTEHLCRHRRRTDDRLLPKRPHQEINIENHVKLREELNERLRFAEMERDHFRGAVGGTCTLDDISPPIGQISLEVENIEYSDLHFRESKHSGRTFTRKSIMNKGRRDSSSSSDDQRYEG
ncbi:mitogen-activated protein kinase 4-like [Liolophura sinensis]|uniref:mitogen-activated protein kinase 4-like n=1 Tax=Liolophura sinensis TaxID=3198878 RepID=UPI00315973D6